MEYSALIYGWFGAQRKTSPTTCAYYAISALAITPIPTRKPLSAKTGPLLFPTTRIKIN